MFKVVEVRTGKSVVESLQSRTSHGNSIQPPPTLKNFLTVLNRYRENAGKFHWQFAIVEGVAYLVGGVGAYAYKNSAPEYADSLIFKFQNPKINQELAEYCSVGANSVINGFFFAKKLNEWLEGPIIFSKEERKALEVLKQEMRGTGFYLKKVGAVAASALSAIPYISLVEEPTQAEKTALQVAVGISYTALHLNAFEDGVFPAATAIYGYFRPGMVRSDCPSDYLKLSLKERLKIIENQLRRIEEDLAALKEAWKGTLSRGAEAAGKTDHKELDLVKRIFALQALTVDVDTAPTEPDVSGDSPRMPGADPYVEFLKAFYVASITFAKRENVLFSDSAEVQKRIDIDKIDQADFVFENRDEIILQFVTEMKQLLPGEGDRIEAVAALLKKFLHPILTPADIKDIKQRLAHYRDSFFPEETYQHLIVQLDGTRQFAYRLAHSAADAENITTDKETLQWLITFQLMKDITAAGKLVQNQQKQEAMNHTLTGWIQAFSILGLYQCVVGYWFAVVKITANLFDQNPDSPAMDDYFFGSCIFFAFVALLTMVGYSNGKTISNSIRHPGKFLESMCYFENERPTGKTAAAALYYTAALFLVYFSTPTVLGLNANLLKILGTAKEGIATYNSIATVFAIIFNIFPYPSIFESGQSLFSTHVSGRSNPNLLEMKNLREFVENANKTIDAMDSAIFLTLLNEMAVAAGEPSTDALHPADADADANASDSDTDEDVPVNRASSTAVAASSNPAEDQFAELFGLSFDLFKRYKDEPVPVSSPVDQGNIQTSGESTYLLSGIPSRSPATMDSVAVDMPALSTRPVKGIEIPAEVGSFTDWISLLTQKRLALLGEKTQLETEIAALKSQIPCTQRFFGRPAGQGDLQLIADDDAEAGPRDPLIPARQ